MKTVLIVEPDLAFAMACLRAFVAADFHTEHATSVGKALAALNNLRPDAVIVSFRAHDSRPLRLLGEIRSTSQTRALPVVAFAREDVGNLLDNAQLEGATECLNLGRSGAQGLVDAVKKLLNLPAESPAPAAPKAAPPVAPAAPTPRPAAPPPPEPPPPAPKTTPPTAQPQRAPAKEPPFKMGDSMPRLKALSRSLFEARDSAELQPILLEMHHRLQTFGLETEARKSGLGGSLAEVLRTFLKELGDNPRGVSPSSVRTIFQAVLCLESLQKHALTAAGQPEPQFRILAVDDEPGIRGLVQRSLALAGLTPDSAKNSSEALDFARQQRYDLFILDVNMPGLSGFELCEKLRASATYRKTPVIFVTGSDNFESRVRSAGSGGNDFIGKPFLPKELAVKALIHLLPRVAEPGSQQPIG